MERIRTLVFAAILPLAGGCALSFTHIRTELAPLQGQPLSAAAAKLGQPTEEKTEFGKRVVIWNKEPAEDSDGDDQECVIKAFMKGDTIEDIRFAGDETQCYRFADALKKQ